jgi:imidazole glycerol-phosphate synthase subunit HisH
MKVAIVNYGMGNLGSVRRAFEDLGAQPIIANHPAALFDAQRIVLPGVGAFPDAMARLNQDGWTEALKKLVREDKKPLLGICLGMQLLAERGTEVSEVEGLGLIRGTIRRLDELGCRERIPHVGWNELEQVAEDPLFAHIPQRADFYFVHSYAYDADGRQAATGTADYGIPLVASVREGNAWGTQFHPEKSSRAGRQVLRNFLEVKPC